MEIAINSITLAMMFITVTLSLARNKDLFSPIKIFSAINLIFYADLFFSEYNNYIRIMYLCQTGVILALVFFEPKVVESSINNYSPGKMKPGRLVFLVWVLSLVPIVNQLLIIIELGGVGAALGNIAYRVQYFKGSGFLLVLNSTIIVLNMFHAMALAIDRKRKYLILYLGHCGILIFMGMMSGSRSFILMSFVMVVGVMNYLGKRIGVTPSILLLTAAVVLGGALGTLRNQISYDGYDISVTDNDTANKAGMAQFRYGLIPLQIITKADLQELKYGETYLSLITNFIPRSLYENKLDSGGVYFTKTYTGDAWEGYSNLATGAITEGIINFGWFMGPIIGFGLIVFFYSMALAWYRNIISKAALGQHAIYVIPYVAFVFLAARFSYSEFSYVLFNYALTILFPVLIYIFFYKVLSGLVLKK